MKLKEKLIALQVRKKVLELPLEHLLILKSECDRAIEIKRKELK